MQHQPPLLELPHVCTFSSIGLIDVAHDTPEVVGTATLVALTYRPQHIMMECLCGRAPIPSAGASETQLAKLGLSRANAERVL